MSYQLSVARKRAASAVNLPDDDVDRTEDDDGVGDRAADGHLPERAERLIKDGGRMWKR